MMHLPSTPSESTTTTTHPSMTMTMALAMAMAIPITRAARTVPRTTMMTMVAVVAVVAMSHHGLGRRHVPASMSMGTATSEAKAHLAKGWRCAS